MKWREANKKGPNITLPISGIATKAVGLMAATFSAKLLAFARGAICAAIFGTTWQTDAFYMANSIIGLFGELAGSFTIVSVPTRLAELRQKDQEAADSYSSSLLNMLILVSIIFLLSVIVFAPQLTKLFAPLYDETKAALTVSFLHVSAIILLPLAVTGVLRGVLNAHEKFWPAQMMTIPLYLFWSLIPLLLAGVWGIWSMVVGFVIGSCMQMFVLIPYLRGIFSYRFHARINTSLVRETLRKSIPAFLGNTLFLINATVGRAMASGLMAGSVTALNYSEQLISIIKSVVIASATTTLLTSFSQKSHFQDKSELALLTTRAICSMTVLLVPIMFLCLFFSGEIVSVVYQRGAFNVLSQTLTSGAFLFYSVGIVATGVQYTACNCLYSLKETRLPLLLSLCGMILNVAFIHILIGPMQIAGVALATSMSMCFTGTLSLILLKRKVPQTALSVCGLNAAKALVALIPAAAFSILVKSLEMRPLLTILAAAPVALVLYVGALYVLRQEEVVAIIQKMKR